MKLSEREKQLLDTLVEVDTCSHAALKMGITDTTVYNMLYRLRKKQQKARAFINTLLAYRKCDLINKVLSRRISLKKEKETLK